MFGKNVRKIKSILKKKTYRKIIAYDTICDARLTDTANLPTYIQCQFVQRLSYQLTLFFQFIYK